jgi:hypothetical protein
LANGIDDVDDLQVAGDRLTLIAGSGVLLYKKYRLAGLHLLYKKYRLAGLHSYLHVYI